MTPRRFITFLVLILLPVCASGQRPQQSKPPRVIKKKNENKEPVTQTLPLLKDPPGAIAAETAHLTFHVSPLSDKGLLSQQTRDAVKALMQLNHGATLVKLRAFVAGTGDMRRVQSIVSEAFTEKKQPLPALSTIQVGALPLEGAQVEIESISVADKAKATNPNGLALFSGMPIAQLESAAKTAQVGGEDMLRVTCFLSSLDQVEAAHSAVKRAFPAAAVSFVQSLRLSSDPTATCEGIGRRMQAGDPVVFADTYVLVNTPKLVFSGIQMAFRDQDADLRLAFARLGKALEPLGAGYKDVVYSSIYPLTRAIEEKTRGMLLQFLPVELHPAATTVRVEGLPSIDATMAIEVVAAVRN